MQPSDGGLLFSWRRVPKQTRLERKGNKRENGGRRGTPESRVEVCASANLSDRGLGGAEERKQKPRSERGVTAAAAAMTFAGPAIRIKGRNRMRRSTL